MRELDKVLNQDEKVFWEGRPKFWPFFLGNSAATSLVGLVWMGLMVFFAVMAFTFSKSGNHPYFIFVLPHFWIGLLMLFGPIIYNGLVYKRTYYAITNKRVILQKGVIGRDFEMVDFDQITNAEVNVGVLDQLFGGQTGSIHLQTAGAFVKTKYGWSPRPYRLSNVFNPYEVFKFFKQVSHDVKTDIEYPNKFRPTDNPGYKTDYTPPRA